MDLDPDQFVGGGAYLFVAGAGCFNPKYSNGNLKCDNGKCPSGYHCADNDTCWLDAPVLVIDTSTVSVSSVTLVRTNASLT